MNYASPNGKTGKRSAPPEGLFRRFCYILLPLLVVITVTMAAFLIQEIRSRQQILYSDERQMVELMGQVAENEIKSSAFDLIYLASHPLMQQWLLAGRPAARDALLEMLSSFGKSAEKYDQIRFIDDTGMERIRINFKNGKSRIVPDPELQNKANRYYFSDTLRLHQGRIFVSPMDLNVEQGRIETPFKPMIRFGIPVFDPMGRQHGVVILNYLADRILSGITRASAEATGVPMLLNHEGFWLKGQTPADEWGFMFQDRNDKTLATRDPAAWQTIRRQDQGQFTTAQGSYTFATVRPLSYGMLSSPGDGAASPQLPHNPEYHWNILSFVSTRNLERQSFQALGHFIPVYGLIVLILVASAWRIALTGARRSQAMDKLTRSEEKYRTLVDNSPMGVYHISSDGWPLYINPSLCHMLAINGPDEITPDNYQSFFTPESLPIISRNISEQQQGFASNSEITIINQANRRIEATIHGVPLRSATGQTLGFIGMVSDITRMKQAAHSLQEREIFLRSILESALDSIITIDHEGRITEFNPGAEKVFGYSRAEILGKRLDQTIIPKRFQEKHRQGLATCMKTGKGPILDQRLEVTGVKSDGTEFPVELTVTRCDPGGSAVFTGFLRDISGRKEAEAELRRTSDILSSILESSTEYAIAATDLDFRIIHYNPTAEKIFGYSVQEVLGKTVQEMHTRENVSPDRFEKAIAKVRKEGKYDYETVSQDEKGQKSFIESTVMPMKDRAGKTTGYILFSRDITGIRKLESQLAQSQKMEAIGTLAGGIAHDFNNILGAIMGYTQLTQLNSAHNTRIQKYLEQILTASDRAKRLIQQILAFSRLSNAEMIPCDIGTAIKEALKLLRASLPATIEMKQSIDTKSDTILADQTQIHQVMMNLCTNAAHAMETSGGLLTVNLYPVEITPQEASFHEIEAGRYLMLSVTDTGCGMDDTTMAHIFEPYFTTKKVGEGTRMGLATVHGIIKDHGGAIRVKSTLGAGSKFDVLLPVIEKPLTTPSTRTATLPTGHERILLVDDEDTLVETGSHMLEKLGYSVYTQTHSRDALAAVKADPDKFDMVLTDMTMPGMTGEELAVEILKIRPNLPIIICTGFSKTLTAKRAEEAGIRSLIMKPLRLQDLAITVREVLDQAN